jgi:peptidoglycan/LPS O-acetylase OafA/YrhL
MNRLAFLDFLRGFAALSVAYFHGLLYFAATEHPPNQTVLWITTDLFALGQIGVIVFFAISGFVIPYSLLNTSTHPVARFSISRFFRLYPAYWLSMGLALIFMPETHSVETVLANITMLQQFFGKANIIGLYWTLQIELIFYFLCVMLFITGSLFNKRAIIIIAVGFLTISAVGGIVRGWFHIKLPLALPLGLAIMFFGFLWRDAVLNGCATSRRYSKIFLTIFSILMPIICITGYNTDMGFGETWYRYLLSYAAALIIFMIFTTRIRIKNRVFSYLGRISYSLYLFHPIVIAAAASGLGERLSTLSPHLAVALILVATVLLSAAIYELLEKPAIELGKTLIRRRETTSSARIVSATGRD